MNFNSINSIFLETIYIVSALHFSTDWKVSLKSVDSLCHSLLGLNLCNWLLAIRLLIDQVTNGSLQTLSPFVSLKLSRIFNSSWVWLIWFAYWFSGVVASGNSLLKCDECRRNFKSKAALARHSHVHDVQRPFLCHCGQSYKRYKHLERHLLVQHNTVIRQTEDQVLVAVCTDEAPQHFIDITQQEAAAP